MPGQIFNIQDDGALVPMEEQPFANEDLFQELLARYPNLLAGDQIDSAVPRRWLLVKREMGIPGEEAGSERWSLDHLFLDQEGIPTLVEVKRSTDTRLRREVVGQMLDYAANAVVYWPAERIRAEFEASGEDVAERLLELLGDDGDPEKFWEQVKTNLQAKRIRMLFVADVIPPELRRIVEFLNEITDPVEVLAVKIKHYVGQGLKTLVPRVIGQTERRPPGGGIQWNEESFFKTLTSERGAEEAATARAILAWARKTGHSIQYGRGKTEGSLLPWFKHGGKQFRLIGISTKGVLTVGFGGAEYKLPSFDEDSKRREMIQRLEAIPDVTVAEDAWRTSWIPLASVSGHLEGLFSVLDWLMEQVKAA